MHIQAFWAQLNCELTEIYQMLHFAVCIFSPETNSGALTTGENKTVLGLDTFLACARNYDQS